MIYKQLVQQMGMCVNQKSRVPSGLQEPTTAASQVLVYNDLLSSSILSPLPKAHLIITEFFRYIQEKKPHKHKIQFRNIFRASDHSHKASAFRQICNNIANTLVIAITTQNRIFGGFTPCRWLNGLHYQYEEDIHVSSFLFSVNNDKIIFYSVKPQQKQKAIVNHEESGPIFGEGHDLYISDQSDKYDSWCNIGQTYECNFQYGTKKANMELSGQLRHKLKDYQIWQLVA